MKVQYFGHSCFSVTIAGKVLLFDPFISQNPLASGVDISTIQADYIFITHGHFDHIYDTMSIARRTGAVVVAGWELYNWFKKEGIAQAIPINPGGSCVLPFCTVRCIVAQHSSSLPDGSYGGIACGFAIFSEEGSFYYSGDTALSLDMQLVAKMGSLDFLVLPIGGQLTMGVEDAIELAEWLSVSEVVGVHYDTFDFIRIDHQQAVESFHNAGMRLHLVPIGDSVQLKTVLAL